jgi:hypothetical protein
MRTYGGDARGTRASVRVFDDAVAALVQDASEYGLTGFVGGFAACFATVVLRLMHSPAADALIAPVVVAIAALTLATASEAFARGAENLQPDAGGAFLAIWPRAGAHLLPWLRFGMALFVAVFVLRLFGGALGFWAAAGLALALVLGSWLYAWPRSFYTSALVAGVRTPREAAVVSGALVRLAGAPVLVAWMFAAAPTLAVALIGLAAGFGPASAGIVALVAVGTTPFLAAVMSILFAEASAQAQQRAAAAPPRRLRATVRGPAGPARPP